MPGRRVGVNFDDPLEDLLFVVLLVHAVIGLGLLVAGPRLRRGAFAVAAAGPVAALAWAVAHIGSLDDGGSVTQRMEWVPQLGLALEVRFDGFALLMTLLVSGVGLLVLAYAPFYMGRDESSTRLAGMLLLFSGAMLGLVLADNLLWLFVCWELTSITSYLLIGHDDRNPAARASALQALLITGGGGLAMMGGFVLLGIERGTSRISELTAGGSSGSLMTAAAVLILVGAFTKSAQYPFHSWLPGAMVAPTPISAYLHSAAMVKAGVYLVMRLNPAFELTDIWRPLIVSVGAVTMVAGGLRAIRQHDLKLLLAHGTVSQLGFLMVLAGTGTVPAVVAGCALLVAHAAFKAALFMCVGIIDHQTHTRDLRRLGGFGRRWRPTIAVATISAASMAGVAPLAGFLAKETAFDALAEGSGIDRLVLAAVVGGSILTVAYSIRFVWGAFVTKPDAPAPRSARSPASAPDEAAAPLASPSPAVAAAPPTLGFLLPAIVLGASTIVLGVFPSSLSAITGFGAEALDPAADVHLALWHGVNLALVLSVVALAGGAVVFLLRRRLDPIQHALRPRWSGDGAYQMSVRALTTTAERVTGVAQPGSLPLYAGVVLLTAAVVPGVALLMRGSWPEWPEWISTTGHLPVAGLVTGGAVAATIARRRFTSALLLGAVGYGMSLLFVINGAPDLALTQFAIETLTVVLFLLVLRFLPDEFERRPLRLGHVFRIVVSAAVGAFVFAIMIIAAAARTEPPVSREMTDLALTEAGGRNVVNVILVDFRGLDTLGEITVLAVSAIGAVALGRAGLRRSGGSPS